MIGFPPLSFFLVLADEPWWLVGFVALLALVAISFFIRARLKKAEEKRRRERRRARRKASKARATPTSPSDEESALNVLPKAGVADLEIPALLKAATKDALPGKGMEVAMAKARTQFQASPQAITLPTGMKRIMGLLKGNRRYEFKVSGETHIRLGGPFTGGLFADVHFSQSSDESVRGLLNPD